MKKFLHRAIVPSEHNDYLPHSMRGLSLLAFLGLALVITLATVMSGTFVHQGGMTAEVRAALLTQLTNESREENGLSSLRRDPLLDQAAQLKANHMIANQYFAHNSPDGVAPWAWFDAVGYDYEYAGENLAIDFYDTRKVNEAWMDSPTHRANIVGKDYKDIGIAVANGRYQGRNVAMVVQLFGSKRIATNSESAQMSTYDVNKQELESLESLAISNEQSLDSDVLGEQIVVAQAEVASLQNEESEGVAEEKTEEESVQDPVLQPLHTPISIPGEQAGERGRIALLVVASVLSLLLFVKIGIEIKRQHWQNVAMAVLTLLVMATLYLIVLRYFGQVTLV